MNLGAYGYPGPVPSAEDLLLPGTWPTGKWFAAGDHPSSVATSSSTSGTLRCGMVRLPTGTITDVALEVTTAGASNEFRIGLWRDNGEWAPGVLVKDFGAIDASSTGVKTISGSVLPVRKGTYWVAAGMNCPTPPFGYRGMSYSPGGSYGSLVDSPPSAGAGRTVTFGSSYTYPFVSNPTVSVISTTQAAPLLFFKIQTP